jgi:hypothetical protein
MSTFAIIKARKPSRIGSLAICSSALVCAAASPVFSADLPYDDTAYRPGYYRNDSYNDSYYSGYNNGCYRCGCCGRRFVRVAEPPADERPPYPVVERSFVERPVIERVPVAERHWVQRDYIERRYPYYATGYTGRSAYPAYPGPYRYSYRVGPDADSYPVYEAPPPREPRRRLGYGGGYRPAPVAYEWENEPRAPYRYVASQRPYDYYRPSYEYEYKPAYEYEPSPRPPATVPERYYGPGYSE